MVACPRGRRGRQWRRGVPTGGEPVVAGLWGNTRVSGMSAGLPAAHGWPLRWQAAGVRDVSTCVRLLCGCRGPSVWPGCLQMIESVNPTVQFFAMNMLCSKVGREALHHAGEGGGCWWGRVIPHLCNCLALCLWGRPSPPTPKRTECVPTPLPRCVPSRIVLTRFARRGCCWTQGCGRRCISGC